MAHAQIEIYPAGTEPVVADDGATVLRVDAVPPWGHRKAIYVEPPEYSEDSGLVYATRGEAFAAAEAKYPHWPIG